MDQALPLQSDAPDFLQGGGMMGARMRAFDWSRNSLGPAKDWPQSLKTAVRIMLTSRFAMWMAWGPELTFFCNDAYLPTTGVKRDWVLGERSDKVWAEIWQEVGSRVEHVLSTGEATWDDELMLFLERSGFTEESYHTFSYSPLWDDEGAIAGMLCVVAEVTERVFAARQLAALRDLGGRLAAASTRADVMAAVEACLAAEPRDLPFALVYLMDADGCELGAAHGLTPGHPAAPQRIARAASDPVWPCPRGATTEIADLPLGPALRDGRGWKTPPERALVAPIRGSEAAEPLGFLVAGLTPHRTLDASYRGFVELVTSQVAAAIARADEFERERARARALAELDRAKTTFFSNVSHEFRTPLTLMMSPLEEALAKTEGGLPEEARTLVETAHRNSLRLLRLVNTLLDFSRVEAGRADAAYRPLDLSSATTELASSFKSLCERAGLSLAVACAPAPEPALVDAEMWEKIVLNLLSNAFKFTLEGGIAVELAYGEGEARLAVRDTGVGIPAHEIPQLFERFHRVEGQQGRSFEGSGIGLALVRELVQLHGGRISVESEVGRGTTFEVAIPLGSAHLPADRVHPAASGQCAGGDGARAFVEEALRWIPGAEDEPEPAPAFAPTQEADARRCRVLLADDNADMRRYVRRLLSARYDVEAAPDGEAALAAAKARRPDLILTDVMMPRLDGFGLLRAIRADEALANVPVVMLSARAGEDARVEGLEAGADDYLAKPFAARELIARVKANVQLAIARRAASEAALLELERRRHAEEALQALNAALEQRVAQEVAERARTEQALRQAQKMEAVGQLTGGVAHDFNNLLTVIMGGLDSIRRCQTWEEARIRRSVDLALQGAQRAASLTARLLAFSRRQPLDPKPLDLNELVRDMTDLLHRTIGEQIELEGVLAPRLWTAEVDQNQLESAILNLAVNARDAMPDGGRLSIETANAVLDERHADADSDRELIPGEYVMVAVSDTGLGMSKETLGRVFEPFFTTKETGRGTGLGLSVVYGFVKQSGGHVALDSEVGRGTTVRLYFPRYLGAGADESEQAARRAPPTSKGESVLVVEDNEEVLYFSASILRELGYRVLEAGEADAALRVLESGEPVDLLFTDVILPGRSGKALADAAQGLRPGLKVLFTTGYSRDAIVHQGRLDPGVRLITKPFTFEGLAARVRHVLES